MEPTKEKLLQLLGREELSDEEKGWLLDYIEGEDQEELQEIMHKEFENDHHEPLNSFLAHKMLREIHHEIGAEKETNTRVIYTWIKRIAVAASIIGILFLGVYFYPDKSKPKMVVKNTHVFKNDVSPGTEKAILSLADGSKIVLDNVKNGTVMKQGNAKLLKTNGEVAYKSDKNSSEVVYDTITTPRGGHYHIELPDKTEVWLNAASSIRIPTSFTGNERVVEITGEAYFEVTKNKKMPFIVKVNNSEVRVFGTHFNIMAYKDEAEVKTTLLEGSVQCVNGKSTCMLKPGQQSELNKDGQFKVTTAADVNDAVAWKNGYFHFDNVYIDEVMRQLSRAYNVDVVYNKKIDEHFVADIPSDSKLSEVLKALELTGKVHFDIQGRQVIVNP